MSVSRTSSLSSLIGWGDHVHWRLVGTKNFLNCSWSSAIIYRAVAMTMVEIFRAVATMMTDNFPAVVMMINDSPGSGYDGMDPAAASTNYKFSSVLRGEGATYFPAFTAFLHSSVHSVSAFTAFQRSQHSSIYSFPAFKAFQRSQLSQCSSIHSISAFTSFQQSSAQRIVHVVDFIVIGRQ